MGVNRFWSAALTLICLAGCESVSPTLAAAQPPPQPAELPGNPSLPVPRLQKPEAANSAIRQTTFESVQGSFPGISNGRVAVQIRAQVNGIPILDDEVRDACYY